MALTRQTWTLVSKNLRIAVLRHALATSVRAFILPVVFMIFISYARNLFVPPAYYGIGEPTPIRSLSDALSAGSGGRDTVVFVNSGLAGGDIDRVIQQLSSTIDADGKTVQMLETEDDLLEACRSSLRGVSSCFGAAVFYSSPNEGPGGMWNYTIRVDGALGSKIDVRNANNDAEIYVLPLQHAVDFAIASTNSSIDQSVLQTQVMEYPFTSETQQQRQDQIRIRYMGGIIQILAVAFFIGMVGIIYHLVGFMASERELGMSQLIEAMMPNLQRWQPQAVRLLAYHLAFDLIYLPGWIVMGLVLAFGVFAKTSVGVVVVFHILSGLSCTSFSLFGAAFFKKAQLSGISTTIISLLLAIVAQVVNSGSTGAIAVLSLLFPPMNYTFFTILMARFERQNEPASLTQKPPDGASTIPGIAYWIFLIVQIFAFPVLAAVLENSLYGTASKGRNFAFHDHQTSFAVSLNDFTKKYQPGWFSRRIGRYFGKKTDTVTAVNALTLGARKGQVVVLLGANGSGKTTTLEAIAGLNRITSGTIDVDGTGGLGICPQKNVMWDDLTVEEHVRIFNRIKNVDGNSTKTQLHELIMACDLDRKAKSRSKTLSGGQKRKLQLGMMFTGGSKVCCVDEVSSGLDPLSRRKIWDILLAERGARTIILTTHFLDEADLLADHIAVLSKGSLKAEGSAVELKHKLGGGYKVHMYTGQGDAPEVSGVPKEQRFDQITYTVPDSAAASRLINTLDQKGIKDYQVAGPTIEDVFLKLAEEVNSEEVPGQTRLSIGDKSSDDDVPTSKVIEGESGSESNLRLLPGHKIGMMRQMWVLFRKRLTIVQRNYLPHCAAFLIPVIAAGLVTLFLKDFSSSGCSPADNRLVSDINSLSYEPDLDLLVGPTSKLTPQAFSAFASTLPGAGSNPAGASSLLKSLHQVDTLPQFNTYIDQRFANVTPGGFFLGDGSSPPTLAYKGDNSIFPAVLTQNAFDTLLTNVSISTQFSNFDVPWSPDAGKTLQLITYFGLAMAAYPAFFGLYPTVERLQNVRALHYSNGVRSLPLWLAYLTFDFVLVAVSSAIAIIIFAAATSAWYHIGYLFVVFLLYGVASTLLSYVVSLFARSQLAAFAFSAAGQAVFFLLYFISYMSVLTFAPTQKIDSYVTITHFAIATITPTGNLVRSMFVALNVFTIACDGDHLRAYPGDILAYGGPILYLSLQSFFLFGLLLWWDSGSLWGKLRRSGRSNDEEERETGEKEINDELRRVSSSNDGLRVLHLSKSFGSNQAVEDITFGVSRGEVFALLGPNGAGKSTTISLIRGDIQPSHRGGEIFVENIPISKHRATARSHLGVCPQFDAMDQMTVIEHLRFYARIRGVADINHNVAEVMRAVGLQSFSTRMGAKLSGGNKRKLSLGIALMGNPTVLLLDEPSSGMDAASKRVMWRTLASVVPGRSLVLTTHSMEEADALANRAGIMAKKMLALGTSDYLRKKHGNAYYIHLITKSAPNTSTEEMERLRSWILTNCPGADVESKTYHGQLKFSVPVDSTYADEDALDRKEAYIADDAISSVGGGTSSSPSAKGISAIFTLLESHKESLGLEYYSVSQTTLDQVFLTIVGKHNIEEENYGVKEKKRRFWQLKKSS
ncbi:MAG: hypothetical protein M4579_002201 [Chaenotheca gracillima]|nr:MAG: hypothetical protein M4579_002201 [Chaenotheca gracillima]